LEERCSHPRNRLRSVATTRDRCEDVRYETHYSTHRNLVCIFTVRVGR
jgi:hypothetical protein